MPPVDTDDLIDLPALRDRMHTVRDLSLKTVSREFVEIAEKKVIITALDRVEGNRKKAAAMMGISYRSLLSKTKAYRIQ